MALDRTEHNKFTLYATITPRYSLAGRDFLWPPDVSPSPVASTAGRCDETRCAICSAGRAVRPVAITGQIEAGLPNAHRLLDGVQHQAGHLLPVHDTFDDHGPNIFKNTTQLCLRGWNLPG